MVAVFTNSAQDSLTSRGSGLGTHLDLSLDAVDMIALLQSIRAGLLHSSNLKGELRERVLGLRLYILENLPIRFRDRLLLGTFLG